MLLSYYMYRYMYHGNPKCVLVGEGDADEIDTHMHNTLLVWSWYLVQMYMHATMVIAFNALS